ncbi:hypothetical protein [Streptomyces sp. 142MFCol3.1]|uniref:hypothetical protein n=1 Tax=Streptomyces sp. 142MFCol3.1 TaxID=1172179 RepID=UPI000416F30A|nr:hypothetical protein [Streptomyces sp. 142MFCol3.1]
MTQSGQGEEPSARPAREGIVLPSDGGAPLLPGTAGDAATPAGGQAWGRPWGPDQSAAPAPGSAEGWGAPENDARAWGAAEPPAPPAPASDWGTSDSSQGWAASGAHGAQQPQGFMPQPPAGAGPLPPEGAHAPFGVPGGAAPHAPGAHAGGYGYPPPVQHPGAALPRETGGYGNPGAALPQATDGYGNPGAALPQETGGYGNPGAAPLDGATQYIPHIPPAPAGDEGATQFIPPVAPGALPPEMPAGDATQFLGRAPQGGPEAGPLPTAGHPDAEATQFIAPVPAHPGPEPYGTRPGGPEDRQPPAEFDNLFRSEPEGPASTQQMPRFDPSAQQAPYGAQAPYASPAPGGRAAARRGGTPDFEEGDGGRGGRSGSRIPLIAAIGVGIAVLGVGAGALLSGGGDSDTKDDGSKTVSATAPATQESASPAADPAKAQAVELDKLLADSSDSRDSVIKAVANVRACNNLDQAASDLRDAAKQRGELVTRLGALSLDKLPNHAALSTALTNAWKASQSADSHYAAWADQVGGKKGCRKGHARETGQTQAATRASGTASTEKEKAARLWNSIASKYGLTQRTRIQL